MTWTVTIESQDGKQRAKLLVKNQPNGDRAEDYVAAMLTDGWRVSLVVAEGLE